MSRMITASLSKRKLPSKITLLRITMLLSKSVNFNEFHVLFAKKKRTCYSNMLQSWHELAVKTAQRVTSEKASSLLSQMRVNLLQLGQQIFHRLFIFLQQHQLEFLLETKNYNALVFCVLHVRLL